MHQKYIWWSFYICCYISSIFFVTMYKVFCDDEVNVTKFFHVWGVPCPMTQCLWPGPHTADRSTGPHPVPGPGDWWHISNLMFLLHYLLLVSRKCLIQILSDYSGLMLIFSFRLKYIFAVSNDVNKICD